MKKIRVTEDGKKFEVYVKFVMVQETAILTDPNRLIGAAYAGSFTACRAVHAALYNSTYVELYDENTGKTEQLRTTSDYRRIETIDGRVTHHFAIPRSAVDEDYAQMVMDSLKSDPDRYPERLIIAPQGNIVEVTGHFLAETYGLPRTKAWVEKYPAILKNMIETIRVESGALVGEWHQLKAVKVLSSKEQDVLDRINIAIQSGLLETKNASLMGEGVFQEKMTTEEYLRANAEILASKLDAHMKPLTDGSNFAPAIGELNRIPVPTQAKASMAILEVLKRKKGTFLVGDMGSGKTQMSLSTIYTYARQRETSGAADGIRVLIISPSNVLPKWATSEIPKVIKRKYFKTRIISSTQDALEYVKEVKSDKRVPKGKIEFVLVSTDRMKLTAQGFVLGAYWDSNRHVWRSPNTGQALESPKQKEDQSADEAIAGWKDAVLLPELPPNQIVLEEARKNHTLLPNGLPKGYVKKWRAEIRAFQDDYKSEKANCSLARPARKEWGETKGNPRWMIADIFQRQLPNHFHFGIVDEVHQMKASDSGRGAALGKIIKSMRKAIMLTGTLTNGASTSIQSLLWRVFPGELLAEGINYKTSKEQWANRYGVIERIVTRDDNDMTVGRSSNRRNDKVVVKERPGISPKLISTFLLDKCVFVDLAELQVPLVELDEIPVIVKQDDDHHTEYQKFHSELYWTAQSLQKKVGTAAWARFNPATINYADQPHIAPEIEFVDREGELVGVVKAPGFPASYITAKEKALLGEVEKEVRSDRRCIIFTHYTDQYGTNERIQKIISDRGFKCEIMNERVSTDKRFEWLDAQAEKGTEVLIMNQRLVEVGLDLMAFPTIMFYQMNDDINVVRQASRRSWRLGQHKRCKVYYFVTDQTTQMIQFQRLMSRRVAAMIVEGRIERSDALAKYAAVKSDSLTADLTKTLESTELAKAWREAASKDMDQSIELVSEEAFQQRITEAFEALTAETIRISGYVAPEPSPFGEIDFEGIDAAYAELKKIEEAWEVLQSKNENKPQPVADHSNVSTLPVICKQKKVEEKETHTNAEQLNLLNDLFAM